MANAEFKFVDGPPFVSSKSLHWGHILVSALKSCKLNYEQMHGKQILNKTGYDCHGLPIEMVVNKLLDVHTKEEVEKLGIDVYNDKCHEVIKQYSDSWHIVFDKIGRVIDHKNEYKTKDTSFMESVWWAFKTMYDKGLIYSGFKIMPYSTGCCTSLSNFEANQNYKDVNTTSLYVKFKSIMFENTYFVAWTTTPWTLPSNIVLCVHPKLDYVKIKDCKTEEYYIVAENCLNNLYPISKKNKKKTKPYEIIDKVLGSDLKGQAYYPLFSYFENNDNKFYQILTDDYVSSETGTGIVHVAPAFGEEDFNLCIKNKVIKNVQVGDYCPIDDSGLFTSTVIDYQGQYVMDANKQIIKDLKQRNVVFKEQQITHSYPMCWRTDTPLIYRAVSSWFIETTAIKEKLIENNKKMRWVPEHIGSKRFANWLENVRDWGVSRSRIFGTPLPIWASDDGEEILVIGSIDELVELANLKERPDNLHRDYIDNIEIPSKQGKGMLKSVKLVLDCWFESGCVPFAQYHYPFENENIFEGTDFLGDFICEGVDQTRGWFYTLLVISTALFDKPPVKDIMCSGLILAEDGKKMSKRLCNYVDPIETIDKYGADAIRLYLIGSPASHAESFKFAEKDVGQLSGKLYQLWNGLLFLEEHITKFIHDGHKFDPTKHKERDNIMDRWIYSRVGILLSNVENYMEDLKIHKIVKELLDFDEDLRNWYIKFNRPRMAGKTGNVQDQHNALTTLYLVFLNVSVIFAPFTPFLSEKIFQVLKKYIDCEEEHILQYTYPLQLDYDTNDIISRQMKNIQLVAGIVRSLRSSTKTATSVKMPLKKVTVCHNNLEFLNDVKFLEQYLDKEVNAITFEYKDQKGLINYTVKPADRAIGKRFTKDAKSVRSQIANMQIEKMDIDEIEVIVNDETIKLGKEYFSVISNFNVTYDPPLYAKHEDGLIIIIDSEQTEMVKELFIKRMFGVTVQNMRKHSNLHPWNPIKIFYDDSDHEIKRIIEKYKNDIEEHLGNNIYPHFMMDDQDKELIIKEINGDPSWSTCPTIVITDKTGEFLKK